MPSLVEIGPVVLEKNIFKSIYFPSFVFISPGKKALSFIWKKNLNAFHPRMLCTKFSWNWPFGSGEEKMSKVYNNYNDDNDSGGQRTNCDQKSSLEPSAQENKKKSISNCKGKIYKIKRSCQIINRYQMNAKEKWLRHILFIFIMKMLHVMVLSLWSRVVFWGVFFPLENFPLIWRRHHYRWRATKGYKFGPIHDTHVHWAVRVL